MTDVLLSTITACCSNSCTPVPIIVFFLMIRRPPRSTLDRSSAASDVYKRQAQELAGLVVGERLPELDALRGARRAQVLLHPRLPVSYTHLRAHETVLDLVCRLLLEQKKISGTKHIFIIHHNQ